MSHFDTSKLGAWADLPFFVNDLPAIEQKLSAEARTVLPPPGLVFKALEHAQPDDVRVVIIGQDPYHTVGKADGLAFSIPNDFGGKLDSLGNIFKELASDLGVTRQSTELSDWARQGVLLLNTALTVPEGQAKAHAKIGWDGLVAQVLERLDDKPRAWLLWGKPAQARANLLKNSDHLRIETAHTSPLSVHRGFFGARPFSRVNEWLQERSEPPIRWSDIS